MIGDISSENFMPQKRNHFKNSNYNLVLRRNCRQWVDSHADSFEEDTAYRDNIVCGTIGEWSLAVLRYSETRDLKNRDHIALLQDVIEHARAEIRQHERQIQDKEKKNITLREIEEREKLNLIEATTHERALKNRQYGPTPAIYEIGPPTPADYVGLAPTPAMHEAPTPGIVWDNEDVFEVHSQFL